MSNKSVYFVTLGCSKNDVDTNIMKSVLSHDKYDIAESLEDANIIIVNTCGFIEDAKQESIDMIFDMIQFKEEHNCEYLIASGCLAQRYPEELLSEIPELDGILGTGQLGDINKLLDSILNNERDNVYVENINSEYVEGVHRKEVGITEYVKISEGCNNNCTYCIIPALRGKNRSRKIEDIHSEVENLVERGTREIILIAQNTSDYGIDLY
ncbi:MAG: radical SAM protein, partial [Tissierellia bacterium]|nr:radical SAM protein [Tissierellia bacterium]